ncbi:hypothetical protein [Streptomyces althioticus]|uniref:hypothetical protein n=1 Tax=Streptomyces althioticus TaxID=83380 RepID=UPI00331CACEE
MLIAKAWYEDGSFWQFAITTLIAVTIGFLGAFATLRASNPVRRLTYRTLTNTSLFVASHSQTGALTVAHHGTRVQRPRVVELELRNTGRRDITAAQFHASQSILYDLGADVVAVLEVASLPTGTVAPNVRSVTSAPSRIEIPPCLLARKQQVNVSLLVDGPKRPVTCLAAPLVDVQVREVPEPGTERILGLPKTALFAGVAGACAISGVFGPYVFQ